MAQVIGNHLSASTTGYFADSVENDIVMVDKSDFIREWMGDPNPVTLITRPRRFGKTTNLTMLKTFFDTADSKLWEPSNFFQQFKIFQDVEFVKNHHLKYPVIFLSLNSMEASTWEDMQPRIIKTLRDLYRGFEYVLSDHKYFLNDLDELNKAQRPSEIASVVRNLSGWLYEKYKRRPLIFIDECDAPMNKVYLSTDETFKTAATSFFKVFFQETLKNNQFFRKACLTGISNLTLADLGSGFNNYTLMTILDDKYSTYFGFTAEEVEAYRTKSKTTITFKELEARYNGYVFGHTRKVRMFNPVSVAGACASNECASFWLDTSSSGFLNGLLRRVNITWSKLDRLLKGEGTPGTVKRSLYEDLGNVDIENTLLHFGYLKYTNLMFSLVNKEVEDGFQSLMWTWTAEAGVGEEFLQLQLSIRMLDISQIASYLSRLITQVTSIKDIGLTTRENVYHMMCLTMLHAARNDAVVRSQPESGQGYPDIVVYWPVYQPENPYTRNALLFEFKVYNGAGDGDALRKKMERMAKQAFAQVERQEYRRGIPDHASRLAEIGICFSGRATPVFGYRELRRDSPKSEWKKVTGGGILASPPDAPAPAEPSPRAKQAAEASQAKKGRQSGRKRRIDER